MPSETADQDAPGHDTVAETEEPHEETNAGDKGAVADRHEDTSTENGRTNGTGSGGSDPETAKRRPARGDEPFEKWEREAMEKLLGEVRGHLGMRITHDVFRSLTVSAVVFPTRFLEGEDVANNFLFNADRSARICPSS
jgi:phospholipase D1/2